ncbi:hypothetical protein LCGC14_0533350 [marine sediment metagenome]|uniref:Uncharacterized protein n=1 Tax=marine sediment metagenome TaxID=412755 RepID=A0A0F9RV10_9ZZZZ
MPRYDESNIIRILSGPVDKIAKFKGKEYLKKQMVIIDRSSNSIKILSMSKGVFEQVKECVALNGNPVNYDISLIMGLGYGCRTYNINVWSKQPLSDEDKKLIREMDIPNEFTVKAYYEQLIVVGAQFRIMNKKVMLNKRDLFGQTFPPCEIKHVTNTIVSIGRSDWDFDVDVSRDTVLQKFIKKHWMPVKTLIKKSFKPTYCHVHRTLQPKKHACCPNQLTGGKRRVIFIGDPH